MNDDEWIEKSFKIFNDILETYKDLVILSFKVQKNLQDIEQLVEEMKSEQDKTD